ncbi:MAG: SRPBCC family protein [Chthoniobacter sp.]|nr:SRPBCC family protein [Chthoniobacter sp.]
MKSRRSRLLLFLTFLLVFPFFLRRRPRVERRITILAPPAAIFPFLNDLRNWPLWTVWDRREKIDYEYGATTAGEGAEQRWASENMSGVLRILKSECDERIDYELDMGDGTYQVVGRLELHPDGACTRIVWKCAWDLAKNPYRRYFDLLMRWMMRRDYAAGLGNLKALVEAPAKSNEAAA